MARRDVKHFKKQPSLAVFEIQQEVILVSSSHPTTYIGETDPDMGL